jgi:hypothetical protein
MSDRDRELLAAYAAHRVRDQMGYYEGAAREYRAARQQVVVLMGLLLALGGIAGVLSTTDVAGPRDIWTVLAVAFPALSTALAAYEGLFAFERVGRLYDDARAALEAAEIDAPDPREDPGAERLRSYVETVEAILRREQAQWGQLSSDIKLAEPPKGS